MPDIDRVKFAYSVAAAMGQRDLAGPRDGQRYTAKNGGKISTAAHSRLGHGRELSAGNFLACCYHYGLEPFDFLLLDAASPHSRFGDGGAAQAEKNIVQLQAVSEPVPRETGKQDVLGATPRGGVQS